MIVTDSYGASLQMTLLKSSSARKTSWCAGTAGDLRQLAFHAVLAGRAVHGFARDHGTGDFSPQTDAKTRNENYGIYFEDTL